MARRPSKTRNPKTSPQQPQVQLVWLRASYSFHTYAYRDPRSVFASAVGCPVVSPTTVLLGIASTLFRLGLEKDAMQLLMEASHLSVIVESPNGVFFFRAFHQIRRYDFQFKEKNPKKGVNPRVGLTKINQGIREYGLVDGSMNIFIGVTESLKETVKLALTNLTHLGTHDSLCSLRGMVEVSDEPKAILYRAIDELSKDERLTLLYNHGSLTTVTLSRFKQGLSSKGTSSIKDPNGNDKGYWWLAGGEESENIPFIIPGRFKGTTRGKVYIK